MTEPLLNKHVVLGVTGSIACYKALDLASKLMQAGALVDTIMSYGATQFVTPLSFRNITHREVVTDTFDPTSQFSNQHVALAQGADIVVIAPATVHCIAKLALGLADDPLTTTVVATRAPLLVAPAMDGNMYDHPATQENLAKLRQRGVVIAGPAPGRLASGLVGMGRLLETPELLGHITATLGREGDLAGRTILVSAGGMTPAYCSPEQANKEPLSSKTDIWSWGLTVLEMFTGEVTWSAGQVALEALEHYLTTGAQDERGPRMPSTLADLLHRSFGTTIVGGA